MRSLIIGIAVGIGLVVAGGIAFVAFYSGPELSVQASAPGRVDPGDPFTVRLQVFNPHKEAVTLDSVDIDNSVLDTFTVLSVDPPASSDSPLAIIGQKSWAFNRVIGPGQQQDVAFEMVTPLSGTFQLAFDVCNAYQDCSRNLLTVRVAAADAS